MKMLQVKRSIMGNPPSLLVLILFMIPFFNSLGFCGHIDRGKYLGLPSMVGLSKKAILSYLNDCIWKKYQFWNTRSLSHTSKEVLIKLVTQAIPSYCMGSSLIPTSLCDELEKVMNSFYWGSQKNGRRAINWMSWDKLILHKSLRGLGFRNMEAFNLLMLIKPSWKLLSDSNSLLTRILKDKYFPRRDLLDTSLGHNPSYIMRNLWSTQSSLTLKHKWKIGDNTKINVRDISWIRSLPSLKPSTTSLLHYDDLSVSHLINTGTNSSNRMIMQSIFNHFDASAILTNPLYSRMMEDTCIWKASVDGSYSVKPTYRILMDLLALIN